MTAPIDPAMAHCARCQHRLGSGCGCECCAWASEAVRVAARAGTDAQWYIAAHAHKPEARRAERERIMREAVQAALPVIAAAVFPHCPTPCDDDCEQPCHEVHTLLTRRDHDPEVCVGTIAAAAVAGERERCATFIQHAADHAEHGKFLIVPLADAIRDGWHNHPEGDPS